MTASTFRSPPATCGLVAAMVPARALDAHPVRVTMPDAGSVEIDGQAVAIGVTAPPRRRPAGIVW